MPNPFDFVKSISSKEYLINSDLDEKDYSPFLVNKAISFMPDIALFSNEVNRMGNLDKKLQYDFYFHAIPKKKRYSSWLKKEASNIDVDSDLELLSKLYCINNLRAIEYLSILTEDQMVIIRELMNEGGQYGNARGNTNRTKTS
jgi:hypothetical protein